MGVGQATTKQTWLLDDVEVLGIVQLGSAPFGSDVGGGDEFDVLPDPGYRHLVSPFGAWGGGLMHCETYPLPAEHTNHEQGWPLDRKPDGEAFQVRDRASEVTRPLRVGDHVRVVGRWTIDHHPESCVTRNRGWLRVGCTWPELHPFRWDTLELVLWPSSPAQVVSAVLSLAGPLHEEAYLGQWKWLANEVAGVAGKVFVADDGSNFHTEVSATLGLELPDLPPGWTPDAGLVRWDETVLRNGSGLAAERVRTVRVNRSSITVQASLTAPPDINAPASGVGVFQGRYRAWWAQRLVGDAISGVLPPGVAATGVEIRVRNIGPDTLLLRSVDVVGSGAAAFTVQPPPTPVVLPGAEVVVQGTFAPPSGGRYDAAVRFDADDPAGVTTVPLTFRTSAAPSGHFVVRVSPSRTLLGRPVDVVVTATDDGNGQELAGQVRIVTWHDDESSVVTMATGETRTITLDQQREFDPETRKWLSGELPSGTVTVPGYDGQRNTSIPFRF